MTTPEKPWNVQALAEDGYQIQQMVRRRSGETTGARADFGIDVPTPSQQWRHLLNLSQEAVYRDARISEAEQKAITATRVSTGAFLAVIVGCAFIIAMAMGWL